MPAGKAPITWKSIKTTNLPPNDAAAFSTYLEAHDKLVACLRKSCQEGGLVEDGKKAIFSFKHRGIKVAFVKDSGAADDTEEISLAPKKPRKATA